MQQTIYIIPKDNLATDLELFTGEYVDELELTLELDIVKHEEGGGLYSRTYTEYLVEDISHEDKRIENLVKHYYDLNGKFADEINEEAQQ